jgi:hypothetical protein
MKLLVLIQLVKALANLAAAGLVAFFHLQRSGRLRGAYLPATLTIVALLAAALPAYMDFGHYPKHGKFANPHEHVHYQLGPKYWRELGYFELYRAMVVANHENNDGHTSDRLRDLRNYKIVKSEALLADTSVVTQRFSPERWDEFKKDVDYFQRLTKERRWLGVVQDKGYHATPVWNMVAATLLNYVVPISWPGTIFLSSLDLLWLLGAILLLWRAFGWRVAALVATGFAFHYMASFPHARGGFLRYDWLACLLGSMALVQLRRFKTAGVLLAWAGMARIFPFIFMFGLGAQLVHETLRTRALPRRYVELFAAFCVGVVFFGLLSIAYDGGLDHWREFLEKIRVHDDDLSPLRVGFRYLFLGSFETPERWGAWEEERLAFLHAHQLSWWAIQALVLGVVFFAARGTTAPMAIALGYVPAFFLTAPTFYYQVSTLVLLAAFASRLNEARHAAGAAGLFLLSTFWFGLRYVYPPGLQGSYIQSLTLLALCVVAVGIAGRDEHNTEPSEVVAPVD